MINPARRESRALAMGPLALLLAVSLGLMAGSACRPVAAARQLRQDTPTDGAPSNITFFQGGPILATCDASLPDAWASENCTLSLNSTGLPPLPLAANEALVVAVAFENFTDNVTAIQFRGFNWNITFDDPSADNKTIGVIFGLSTAEDSAQNCLMGLMNGTSCSESESVFLLFGTGVEDSWNPDEPVATPVIVTLGADVPYVAGTREAPEGETWYLVPSDKMEEIRGGNGTFVAFTAIMANQPVQVVEFEVLEVTPEA